MPEAYLVGGVRTPQGKYGGSLASARPDDLAALVVREAVARAGLPGCSGARLAVTLLGRMERESARRGLATLCVGVGQGVAMLLERP